MDGVGTTQTAPTARLHLRRAHLVLLLAVCLALPVAVLTLAPHGGPMTTEVEAAATVPSSAPSTTARKPTTTKAPTTTEAESTTSASEAETSTTAAPITTAAPSTTTTAVKAAVKAQVAPSTTAAPVTTTTAAPTTTTTAKPATTTTTAASTGSSSDLAFLACVRQRESGGNYAAVSPGGLYRGAYQFAQSTWDSAASASGHPELVGVPVNQVAPASQDAVALWVVQHWGRSPWGGVCY